MRLEKFTAGDRALYEMLVFNEPVMRMNYGRVFTPEEAEFLFGAVLAANEGRGCEGYYKVYDADGRYIGLCGIAENEEYGSAELEYMLLPEYWHKGYGTALVAELITRCTAAGYARLSAVTGPENRYSRRLLERAGFTCVRGYINEDGDPAVLYLRAADEGRKHE